MNEKVTMLVEMFKYIKQRPLNYLAPMRSAGENFLNGFFLAMNIFADKPLDNLAFRSFLESKGLEHRSLIQQFIDKGLTEAEAMDSVLALYIEFFEKNG